MDKRLQENGIKYVVVGEEYNRAIDLLREKYPKVQIVPWHEAPRILTNEYNEAVGGSVVPIQITLENKPTYKRTEGIKTSSTRAREGVPTTTESPEENDIW